MRKDHHPKWDLLTLNVCLVFSNRFWRTWKKTLHYSTKKEAHRQNKMKLIAKFCTLQKVFFTLEERNYQLRSSSATLCHLLWMWATKKFTIIQGWYVEKLTVDSQLYRSKRKYGAVIFFVACYAAERHIYLSIGPVVMIYEWMWVVTIGNCVSSYNIFNIIPGSIFGELAERMTQMRTHWVSLIVL